MQWISKWSENTRLKELIIEAITYYFTIYVLKCSLFIVSQNESRFDYSVNKQIDLTNWNVLTRPNTIFTLLIHNEPHLAAISGKVLLQFKFDQLSG